jgi:hypothetical protein
MSLLTELKRLLPDNYNDVAPLGLSKFAQGCGRNWRFPSQCRKMRQFTTMQIETAAPN